MLLWNWSPWLRGRRLGKLLKSTNLIESFFFSLTQHTQPAFCVFFCLCGREYKRSRRWLAMHIKYFCLSGDDMQKNSLWVNQWDVKVFEIGGVGDDIRFVTDIGGVSMPTTGTAGLTLEKTMKLCFSGQSSNSDKGRHGVNKKGHQACLFTVWFWSHKQRSVLSAWLRCLFSPVRKSHHYV